LPEKNLGHFVCDFHVIFGSNFSNQSTLGAIFARIFVEFAQIFRDFLKISTDFARIFPKSKHLWCARTPTPLITNIV